MRFYLRLPINIHVWGGLGSQLFALALAEDLAQKFPRRDLRFIFHTGGVTYRKLDIAPFLSEYQFVVKDDFTSSSVPGESRRATKKISSKKVQFRVPLKKLATFLGFSSPLDSDQDFRKCKPWVLSVRGHYTYRVISSYSIDKIISNAKLSGLPIPNTPTSNDIVGIQYRLGDLIDLSSKGPVDPELILRHSLSIQNDFPGLRFLLFSDSPENAKTLLSGITSIESRSLDPWATITALTENKFFIGTNSKISQWVVIFRLHLDKHSHNVIPSRFYEEVSKSLTNEVEYSSYLAI